MQTLRLKNRKQKKLDQTIKPRLKSKLLLNNTKFYYTSNNNNNSELGQYWNNSLNNSNNKYSDLNKEKRREI